MKRNDKKRKEKTVKKIIIIFHINSEENLKINCQLFFPMTSLRKWESKSYFLLVFFQESGIGTPVTMRIDPKGFYLYWIDQNNEMDLLDIALIRDVRTGQYAKKPRVSWFFFLKRNFRLRMGILGVFQMLEGKLNYLFSLTVGFFHFF